MVLVSTEKTYIRDLDEKVVEIEVERLRTFTNHPFKAIGDSFFIFYSVLNILTIAISSNYLIFCKNGGIQYLKVRGKYP